MRPRFTLVVCLTFLCALPVLAQDDVYAQIKPLEQAISSGSATREQQLELARLYLRAGRAYEASKLAQGVLANNANDADAMTVRDDAQKALRELTAQQVAAAEAKANAADATDADRIALANAYFDAARYTDAATLYAKLPLDRDTRLKQARALAWSKQLDASERIYADLLASDATPDLELEYGQLLSWMGASRAAVEHLQTADNALHTEASAIALANAYAWNGNRQKAVEYLTAYTTANPNATQAHTLLQQIQTSPDLEVERVSRLIDAQPYDLTLRLQRAQLLAQAGRYSEAARDTRFIREHTSKTVAGLDELDRVIDEKRAAELASLRDQLKTVDHNDAKATLSLAQAFTGVEGYDEAISLYKDYLAQHPEDVDARIAYARVLSWDKRWTPAEAEYQRLLRDNPDRADLKLEYAQVLSYDEDYARAVPMFSSLTDLSNNPRARLYEDVPPRAHYNLGQIYRWYGWQEHAIEHQNAALQMDNGYLPAANELDLVRHTRPASSFEARYTTSDDSNDFRLTRADLEGSVWRNQRTGLEAAIGRHMFEHGGEEVDANVASAGLAYRYNDRWTMRGRLGGTFYEENLGTRPFWGLGAEWIPNFQSRAALDYNRYDLIYDVFTLSSLTNTPVGTNTRLNDPLSIDDFRAHYDWNGGGLLSFLGDVSYGMISDNNNRTAAHGVVGLRLLKSPFVAVKADGRWLQYDRRTNRYWSPTDYNSLAGVLQVGQNVRDRFFWTAELKYGKAWEGDRSSDLRTYSARVTVPINDRLDVVGHWDYGKSGRLDSVFGNSGTDFTNYWQRSWYVGIRVKRLYGGADRHARNSYYFDENTNTTGSPLVTPAGEAH